MPRCRRIRRALVRWTSGSPRRRRLVGGRRDRPGELTAGFDSSRSRCPSANVLQLARRIRCLTLTCRALLSPSPASSGRGGRHCACDGCVPGTWAGRARLRPGVNVGAQRLAQDNDASGTPASRPRGSANRHPFMVRVSNRRAARDALHPVGLLPCSTIARPGRRMCARGDRADPANVIARWRGGARAT